MWSKISIGVHIKILLKQICTGVGFKNKSQKTSPIPIDKILLAIDLFIEQYKKYIEHIIYPQAISIDLTEWPWNTGK